MSSGTVGVEFEGFAGIQPPTAWPAGYSRAVPAPSHWLDLCCLLPCLATHEEIALVALGHGLQSWITVVGLSDLRGIFQP